MFGFIVILVLILWLKYCAVPKKLIRWELCVLPLIFVGAILSLLSLIGTLTSKSNPPVTSVVVSEFALAHYPPAFFTTDYTLKNESNSVLLDTTLNLEFRREDGETISVKRVWSRWDVNEIKTIPVPNGSYEQATAQGTSYRWGKPVEIEASWRIKSRPQ